MVAHVGANGVFAYQGWREARRRLLDAYRSRPAAPQYILLLAPAGGGKSLLLKRIEIHLQGRHQSTQRLNASLPATIDPAEVLLIDDADQLTDAALATPHCFTILATTPDHAARLTALAAPAATITIKSMRPPEIAEFATLRLNLPQDQADPETIADLAAQSAGIPGRLIALVEQRTIPQPAPELAPPEPDAERPSSPPVTVAPAPHQPPAPVEITDEEVRDALRALSLPDLAEPPLPGPHVTAGPQTPLFPRRSAVTDYIAPPPTSPVAPKTSAYRRNLGFALAGGLIACAAVLLFRHPAAPVHITLASLPPRQVHAAPRIAELSPATPRTILAAVPPPPITATVSATLPRGAPPEVTIVFAPADSAAHDRAVALAQTLRNAGIAVAPPIAGPSAAETAITYYFAEDRDSAAFIERALGASPAATRLAASTATFHRPGAVDVVVGPAFRMAQP